MLALYSGAFGDDWRFSRLLLNTELTEFTNSLFVCFIQATEFGVANLFMLAHHWLLKDDCCFCTNEEVLVPLPSGMRAGVLKQGL